MVKKITQTQKLIKLKTSKQTNKQTDSNLGKNVVTFGAGMSSSVYIDNKGEDILIVGESPTQVLNKTKLTAETQYLANFTRPGIKVCLSLCYNGINSFLFVHATKLSVQKYQFKVKDSVITIYPLCLGNISVDFSVNNMKK